MVFVGEPFNTKDITRGFNGTYMFQWAFDKYGAVEKVKLIGES